MTMKDPYERLAEMFDQFPPGISYTPSIMEVLRLQYTPEEADLAATIGLKGIKLDEVQRRTGIERDKLKKMLNTMADKGTIWITPWEEDPNYRSVGIGGPGLVETVASWSLVPECTSRPYRWIPPSRYDDRPAAKYTTPPSTRTLPLIGQTDSSRLSATIRLSTGAARNRQTSAPSDARKQ